MSALVEAKALAAELAGPAPGLVDTREQREYEAGHLPRGDWSERKKHLAGGVGDAARIPASRVNALRLAV